MKVLHLLPIIREHNCCNNHIGGAINNLNGYRQAPYHGVDSVTGMIANGYVVVNQELFKVVAIIAADQIEVARAQDGTITAKPPQGDAVTIYQTRLLLRMN